MFNPVVTTSLTVSTIHDALNPGPRAREIVGFAGSGPIFQS